MRRTSEHDERDESGRREATEVVVVGAGPGGAVLSYLLARSGVETVLIERHTDLSREFRGYAFQPAVLPLFDEMGMLEEVLALDNRIVEGGSLVAFGNAHDIIDYTVAEPYGYSLFMEETPLLQLFIDHASQYENFSYRDGTTVTDLLVEDERVAGVHAKDRKANAELDIDARLVVGADGRFSAVRELAGIDVGLLESDVELVWFKLPTSVADEPIEAHFGDGVLVYFELDTHDVQVGWYIPKGSYPELKSQGIEAFRERLLAVDPRLERVFPDGLSDFGETSLLHIEPGITEEWTRDGLALIGDAAHVASPIGGQSNPAAIQDAAALHPIVVNALDRLPSDGDVSIPRELLEPYETRRRASVETVLAAQRREEEFLAWYVLNHDGIPSAVLRPGLRATFKLTGRLIRRMQNSFALSPDPDPVSVATKYLQAASDRPNTASVEVTDDD